jgi:tyrosyl-tRNA synthetase
LFDKNTNFADFTTDEISEFANYLPTVAKGTSLVDALVEGGLAESKKKAREFIAQGAITISGEKVKEDITLNQIALIKKGKNGFLIVK